MPNFKVRDTTPELMDTEVCTYEDFRSCLEQLAQVNWLTFAYRPTIAFLRAPQSAAIGPEPPLIDRGYRQRLRGRA